MRIVKRVADAESCLLSVENGVGDVRFSVDMSRDGARTESTRKERSETKRPGRERVSEQRTSTERSMVQNAERGDNLKWRKRGERE